MNMPENASGTHGLKRVLLVDDHELVRSGLAELIGAERDLQVCGQAPDAPTAMQLLHDTSPHVAIVDLMLQQGSGIELIKQIKASDPTVRIIVCSMHDDRLYAERALQAGAMGYVNKQEPAERIVEAVRHVLADRLFVKQEIADRILRRAARRGDAEAPSAIETLSDRELEVLELIGQGLTTRAIADKLGLSVKTIDTYREHLKLKLDLGSATELVRFAVAWSIDPEVARSGQAGGGGTSEQN
jgi:DNA-binding NarL/FixJ family response regulator